MASASRLLGKGLATEGGRASLRHGFETLALDRIISIFTADNASSGRVMDKLGMYDCLTTTDAERGIPLLVREITLEGWQQSLPAGPEEDQPHTRRASRPDTMANTCSHLDTIVAVEPSSKGCEDCLRVGSNWVHLRLCMGCGHVGCCDSSPNRHATAHWRANSDHPLVRSYEPGEDWWWCYADELAFEVPDGPPSPSHP